MYPFLQPGSLRPSDPCEHRAQIVVFDVSISDSKVSDLTDRQPPNLPFRCSDMHKCLPPPNLTSFHPLLISPVPKTISFTPANSPHVGLEKLSIKFLWTSQINQSQNLCWNKHQCLVFWIPNRSPAHLHLYIVNLCTRVLFWSSISSRVLWIRKLARFIWI